LGFAVISGSHGFATSLNLERRDLTLCGFAPRAVTAENVSVCLYRDSGLVQDLLCDIARLGRRRIIYRPLSLKLLSAGSIRDDLPFTFAAPPPDAPLRSFSTEGQGLSDEAVQASDYLARIPVAPEADSINVVTAAAIALYELQR
jgi:hypothetical protein